MYLPGRVRRERARAGAPGGGGRRVRVAAVEESEEGLLLFLCV